METLGNDLYIIAGKNKTTAFPNMPFLSKYDKICFAHSCLSLYDFLVLIKTSLFCLSSLHLFDHKHNENNVDI